MKMKSLALACSAALMGISAVAQAEFSGNIGVTSNYSWRGATQTRDSAAISGGLDYAHESGFYVGTWASNVEFDNTDGAQYEVDFYGGYAGEVSDFGYDVGVIYYAYPAAQSSDAAGEDLDFTEIYGSVSYQWLEGGIYYTSASFDLQDSWSVGGTVGHYDLDGTGDDWTHYQLDVTKSVGDFGDFTFSVSKADEEANGDDDPRVFVSWAKSF